MKIYKILFFLILVLITNIKSQTDLTFSEIMFAPSSSNSEFIEIHNLGNSEIDLEGFAIQYQTSNYDFLTSPDSNYILQPNQFAVILEADYEIETGIYSELIPDNTLILFITDNSFGTSGMANSSDRNLYLINNLNDTINSYTYSADNSNGISDEKVLLENENTSSNWANTKSFNGTPGSKNSVSPFDFDIEISAYVDQENIVEGDSVEIKFKITNIGIESAENFQLNIYDNTNLDSLINQNHLIQFISYTTIQSGDSIEQNFIIPDLELRRHQIIGELIYLQDEVLDNNISFIEFDVNPKPIESGDLIINEIMYKPPNDEPEWIEIYNNSSQTINLNNYKILDNSTSSSLPNVIIEPQSYLVLADEEAVTNFYNYPFDVVELNLPSLNNSGDIIVLRDNLNNTIDSLRYFPDWGGDNLSLERIDLLGSSISNENWSSAQFVKATPGKINSVSLKDLDLGIADVILPNEFAVIGDEFIAEVKIKNVGRENSSNALINIYYDRNKDSVFSINELVTTQNINPINAFDSIETSLNISEFSEGNNYYKVELELDNDQFEFNNEFYFEIKGVELTLFRNDLLINEIMFAPNSDEPEWIEIYNYSNEQKNINGIKIADGNSLTRILDSNISINPYEYFIIAKDSSIYLKHEIESKIIISSFPSLNNNGDKVILLDSLERVLDSLEYTSNWDLIPSNSLERIDFEVPSTDSTNWGSSKALIGSTPGKTNSIAAKDLDVALSRIFFEPQFPLEGEEIEIFVMIKNVGKSAADFSVRLNIDSNLDSLSDENFDRLENLFLNEDDSILVKFNRRYKVTTNEVLLIAEIEFNFDEDTLNNRKIISVAPGYQPHSIVINEIMNYPQTGDVEWIELYNRTNKKIDLKDWVVSDMIASPVENLITEKSFLINADNFVIIAKDSSIFNQYELDEEKVIISAFANLNNDEDGVIIKDRFGKTIDSIRYKSTWQISKGYSIEKVDHNNLVNDSTNWKPSIDKLQATPLRINSVSEKEIDLIITSIESLPKNPKSGEEINLEITIKNQGRITSNSGLLKVEFLNEELSGFELNFDQILPKDSVILLSDKIIITDSLNISARIFSTDEDDATNNLYETVIYSGEGEKSIIITEIMFNPEAEEPEWIEIYNTTGNQINLKNWRILDLTSSKKIEEDIYINPNQFLIIVNDSLFFPEISKIILSLPSLGNIEDAVAIKDFRDLTIDSVYYKGKWNYEKGYSIERIDFMSLSNDSSNWISSIDINKSTPGRTNSVLNHIENDFNSVVINEIMFEPNSDNSEFIEIYNVTEYNINIGGWSIIDENGRKTKIIPYSKELLPKNYFTVAADSNFLNFYNTLSSSDLFINVKDGLSLSNSGEKLILVDLFGNKIDSVTYQNSFHNFSIKETKNISIERIKPAVNSNDKFNWSSSVNPNGATPSQQNSIYTEGKAASSKIEISPNPFSPDSDGFEDFTVISYNLNSTVAQLRIRVFDSKGRLVRTILNNQSTGTTGSFIFDGLNDSGKPLRMGIYILLIEALDSFSGTVEVFKEAVVIARKL
jgi:hypothetical protein